MVAENKAKYAPLVRYLAALPADQASVTLSFAALTALVGALPPRAARPFFWRGARAEHNWACYGFRAQLVPAGDAVSFTRTQSAGPAACALCGRPASGQYPVRLYRRGARAPADETPQRPLCRAHVGALRRAAAVGAAVRQVGGHWLVTLGDAAEHAG